MRHLTTLAAAGVFFFNLSSGQESAECCSFGFESHTILSSGQVPFWLEMNRLGQVDDRSQVQQIFLLNWKKEESSRNRQFTYDYGFSFAGRLGNHSAFYPEQYWGRIRKGSFYLLAGALGEPVWENGLSHTNGDFFLSNNARPNPRAEIGAENYTPFHKGWLNRFSLDFRYGEYLLLDDRIVDHANLHHKKLMVSYRINPEFTFHAGLDHWVFWGGTSPNPEIGKIPGFNYYLRYIFGLGGGDESPKTDQENIAGNQLGQNLFQLDFRKAGFELKVYYQHLFDDGSGFLFHNMQDGFWGISYRSLQKNPWISGMVLEFVNTTNQSGPYHKYAPDPSKPDSLIGEGRDNYFNHGVYQSGFVSYNRMIGSPFFIPTIADGVSTGFESTRLRGLHGAIDGYLNESVYWSGRGTYSRYYGLYDRPFPEYLDLWSLEADIRFDMRKKPFSFGLKVATDWGSYLENSWGCEFSLLYRIK